MSRLTTIAVSAEVYDALRNQGKTGDTFDRVLRRILGLPASGVREARHQGAGK